MADHVPLGPLVRAVASEPAPPAGSEAGSSVRCIWWAVQHVWGAATSEMEPFRPLPRAASQPAARGLGQLDISLRYRPRLVHVRYGSPLDVVMHLPWNWFAAGGGGALFIKAVEYWLNTPKRIRVESARLSTRQVILEADRLEAEARKLRAMQDIEALRTAHQPALDDGALDVP